MLKIALFLLSLNFAKAKILETDKEIILILDKDSFKKSIVEKDQNVLQDENFSQNNQELSDADEAHLSDALVNFFQNSNENAEELNPKNVEENMIPENDLKSYENCAGRNNLKGFKKYGKSGGMKPTVIMLRNPFFK